MDVTVAIPVRNGAAVLGRQLAALAAQDFEGAWEVIVGDNGSTDGSGAVAMSYGARLPSVRVVDASDRRGVSHARNVALSAAAGRCFLTCDADDEVAPGWITALHAALDDGDLAGGVLDHDGLNEPVVRTWRGSRGRSRSLPVHAAFLPYAVGNNFGARTDVLRALGGWDEAFVDGGDDVELSWRAQLAGHRLVFAPDAVVHVRHRTTLRGLARQSYGYGRSTPQLQRAYADSGIPRRPATLTLRRLVRHGLDAADLVSRERRGGWIRSTAKDVGELVGAVRHPARS